MDGITYIVSAILLVSIALHHARTVSDAGRREHPRSSGHPRGGGEHAELSRAASPNRHPVAPLLRRRGLLGPRHLPHPAGIPGRSLALSAAGLALGLGMGLGSVLVNARHRLKGREIRMEAAFFGLFLPAPSSSQSGAASRRSREAPSSPGSPRPLSSSSRNRSSRAARASTSGAASSPSASRDEELLSRLRLRLLGPRQDYREKRCSSASLVFFLHRGILWIILSTRRIERSSR